MKLKTALKGAVAGLTLVSGSAAFAGGHGELNVAYFLEWPMPFQAAKVSGAYDAALGMKVNWVSFDTGTAMSAAMASGDIDISVSQGVPPFVVATSAGQDLQIVMWLCPMQTMTTVWSRLVWKSTKTPQANWLARKLPCRWALRHTMVS